ncbi:hypothetical protein ACIQ1D_19160 [Lysinibacillus xylanilyticus]|uniref:hypothetical protein n=1 Tax=Lysinibacillus xylanilyticus TaxID=582475 RepID=UPI00382F6C93
MTKKVDDKLFGLMVEEVKKLVDILGDNKLTFIIDIIVEKHLSDKGLSERELGEIAFQIAFVVVER